MSTLQEKQETRKKTPLFTKSDYLNLLALMKKDSILKSIGDIYEYSNLGKEVYKLAKEKMQPCPETWNKNEKASLEWCSNFLKYCLEDTTLQSELKLKFPNLKYEVEPRKLDIGKSISSIRPSEAPQSEQDTIDPVASESQKQPSDKKFEFTIDKKALLQSLEQNFDVKSIKDICENTNVGEIAYNLIKEKQKPKLWKSKLPRKYQIDILKQCVAEHSELFEIQFPNVTLSTEASETYDKFFKAPLKSQIDTKKLCTSSMKEVDEPQPEIQFIKEMENQENKTTKFSETPLLESHEREKEKRIEPSLKSQVTDSRSAIEEFYEYEQNTFTWDKSIEELEEENIELEKGSKKMKYDLYDLDDD